MILGNLVKDESHQPPQFLTLSGPETSGLYAQQRATPIPD